MADILAIQAAFPNVTYRYYVEPTTAITKTPLDILDGTNSTMTYQFQMQGRLDGENAIKMGPGFIFEKIQEWYQKPELQKDHPHMRNYIHEVEVEMAREFKY